MPESPAAYGDIKLQISRLMHAACCRDHAELAELLEIPLPSVSQALSRKRIPRTWESSMLLLGINPEYVLNGAMPKYLTPAAGILIANAADAPIADTLAGASVTTAACGISLSRPDKSETKPEALTLRRLLRCFSKEELQKELGRRSRETEQQK